MYQSLIDRVAKNIKERFQKESSGHDWLHIERVHRMALRLAIEENARTEVVELAALLHDIADWKFTHGSEVAGGVEAKRLLIEFGADSTLAAEVADIIDTMSFRGAKVPSTMKTIEGQCVQDADRLDALGAIGIARCFAYGGHAGRLLYNPNETPTAHASFAEYKSNTSAGLTHFHEKLYLLKDLMNTPSAKAMAIKRHQVMEDFERDMLAEIEGIS